MNLRFKKTMAALGAICLSIAGEAADKKEEAFRPGPISSFKGVQKQAGLSAGARAYVADSGTKTPFGKLNPNEEGVLPVLLLLENKGKQALNLMNITVRYEEGGRKFGAVPAREVKFLRAPSRPRVGPGPIPGVNRKKKNPLAAVEIEIRGFAAQMLPAGESAYGFFYFQAEHRPGAILYISGIREANTGNELFFMEIPVD